MSKNISDNNLKKIYNRDSHLNDLIENCYYSNLIKLRHTIQLACDSYFQKHDAFKVDLFLITKGVSSPMGKGSDSIPISFTLGNEEVFLVDSAQFGMETLLLNSFKMVYCYLPSFRGEDADYRHLNQFFHCEAELKGDRGKCIKVVNGLVKHLISEVLLVAENSKYFFKSSNFNKIKSALVKKFPEITFDEAHLFLRQKGYNHLIEKHEFGRTISAEGEKKIAELVGASEVPVWILDYDRDTVAFYQKPLPADQNKVLNADLIFPAINGSFGGEIVGCGQRQDNCEEMVESMQRQEIENTNSYKWYIDLRRHPRYTTSSGFGLGIERFIAWILGLDSIIDTIPYPVIKNNLCV